MGRTTSKKNKAPDAFEVKKQTNLVSHFITKSQASAYGALGIIVGAVAVLLAIQGPTHIQDRILQEIFKPANNADVSNVVPLEHQQVVDEQQLLNLHDTPVKPVNDDVWVNLLKWISSEGGSFPDIEIVSYPGVDDHRGIITKRNLKEGDMVMTIPRSCLITTDKVRSSEIGKRLLQFKEFDNEDQEQTLMGLYLLDERAKGKESWFYPYIQTLPVDFRNVPINFNEEEVAMLKGSYSQKMYESDVLESKETYDILCSKAADLCEKYDYEDFKWGRLAVMTRVFAVEIDGKETSALQPYADMINHSNDRDTTWEYRDDLKAGTVVIESEVEKGSALSLSYGEKGNERLLSYYGFALPNNPFNLAVVYIGISDNDELAKEKLKRAHNPDAEKYRLLFKVTDNPTEEGFIDAMKLCRLVVATADELEHLPVGGSHGSFSPQNERRALLLLQSVAEDELSEFPQTLEEDEELLKDSTLSFNHRNIILTRHGEKQTLRKIIDFVDNIIPLLDVENMAAFRKLRYLKKYTPYRAYVREIAEIHRKRESSI